MKKFKEILKETNVSAGLGIRGLGNVTGEPAIDDDNVSNYIQNNQEYTDQLKSNMTDGLYGAMDDNWWMDKKEMKAFTKKGSITGLALKPISKTKTINEGMEKDHYKAIDDVHVNLENRNHAIDEYGYGPLNPKDNNKEFWNEKAELWKTTSDKAMKSRCHNCAAFNQSKEVKNRISNGLGPAGKKITELADLGFCEMFHFKCAGSRTCDAWLVNGPIKEEAPAGNVGGIAGTGDERLPPSQREPGVPPKTQYKKKNELESPVMGDILRRKMTLSQLKESWEEHHGDPEKITKMMDRSHDPDTQESIALWGNDRHHSELINKHGDKLTPNTKQTLALHGSNVTRKRLVNMKNLDHGTKQMIAHMGPDSIREILLDKHSLDHDTKNLIADSGSDRLRDILKHDHDLDNRTKQTIEYRNKYPNLKENKIISENTGKFAGNTTHKVPHHVFNKIIKEKNKGKHWKKYLGAHETTIPIRDYANKNPKKPVIIEDESTGYMCYARYGK